MIPPYSFLRILSAIAALATVLHAQPAPLVVTPTASNSQTLNGPWRFKYLPVAKLAPNAPETAFSAATFDDTSWSQIAVPAHWELAGFAEPRYGKTLAEGTGLYRRTFSVPAAWNGQHVFLRFDGVLSGFEVFINGTRIGEWASGYNAVAFDITSALRAGPDNLIAVNVTTRSKGWEFDTNDCWALSGIYRDVTLFAVPAVHFQDYATQTKLNADGSATLTLSATASEASNVSGRLLAPDGKLVREFQFATSASATLVVTQPQLWTAETPSLYTLELALASGQKVTEKIGLREITIVDGVLQLNGRPIKLRGVDHHDMWPDVGRAATEAHLRRDLDLIKAANINFVRTSHYPPHRRLLALCDEMGIYVMDEVPFGFGDEHLTDPTYQESLLTRADATVARDRNHPSIIVWSIGNENPNTPLTFATARRVKALDPTRPVCFPQVGSYFARTFAELPADIDIYAPHYPVVSTVRDYATRMTRPVIFTEYAHALGLASDRIQEEWAIMQASPRIAGGAVWMFQDQGILRPATARPKADRTDFYVWPDANHYYDTDLNQGADGIVYSDRTPQTDYWQVRKVYSPVQVQERSLTVRPGAQTIALHVENRFDFRSLAGLDFKWEIQRNGVAEQSGHLPLRAAARPTEDATLALTLPSDIAGTDVFTLALRCADGTAPSFYEHTVRLGSGGDASTAIAKILPTLAAGSALTIDEQPATLRVTHVGGEVKVDRATGEITLFDRAGTTLASGLFPHIGRRFTETELLRAPRDGLWTGAFLRTPATVAVELSREADGSATILIRGRYPRPDAADQALEGSHRVIVRANGTLEVSYDYKFAGGKGAILEAGISLLVPAEAGSFRWLGAGPYAGYPGKDVLNNFGAYHLHRDDLRFQGNHRDVEAALLARPTGAGLALFGLKLDLAVERVREGTVVSHNAIISSLGNKGSSPEINLRAENIPALSGRFTLLPLGPEWPSVLTRWFGASREVVAVQQPFYHSYDQ